MQGSPFLTLQDIFYRTIVILRRGSKTNYNKMVNWSNMHILSYISYK